MIKLCEQRAKYGLYFEEVDNKASVGVNWSFKLQFNPIRMSVHSMAFVSLGHMRQAVS
ncbi:hypothetical protein CLV41_1026 [Roseibium marinum]|uniref:Uncharacterized protein n=1 Tax=Roseibium marinum TaxID=281252 RepID=A0A2S3UY46_9HYPH|nr:hypothetical protein CLV41_1026 [Roseibium marinum]